MVNHGGTEMGQGLYTKVAQIVAEGFGIALSRVQITKTATANVRLRSAPLKTNTVSNTAFRGFGGPQGLMAAERVIEEIAFYLNKDPMEIRRANFYGNRGRDITPYHQKISDNITRRLMDELITSCDYTKRRAAVLAHNAKGGVIRKGIAMTPVKFGISFTATWYNQAGALVHVYKDGSVMVNHGGTEMGQGLYTKVAQIVAEGFGIALSRVQITKTATANVRLRSAPLKTNTVSNTAFRGFGGPQGLMMAERVIEEIAFYLNKDPMEIRRANFYGNRGRDITPYHQKISDNITRRLMDELITSCDYTKRRAAVLAHNAKGGVIRKGIAMTPVKFGISFTATWYNQAGALVHVYKDGSVMVNHGGTEMGQGLYTKVAQIVAEGLWYRLIAGANHQDCDSECAVALCAIKDQYRVQYRVSRVWRTAGFDDGRACD